MSKQQISNIDLRRYLPVDARLQVADSTERLALKYVYEGLITYQLDTNEYWKYIGTPPSNLSGDWELGIGEKGEAGTSVFTGTIDPSDVTGNNGDFYFQTQDGASYSAGDWFQKSSGVWGTPIFNSVGPQGPAGADASALARYGGLWTYENDAGTPQDLTTANTYYKITQWLNVAAVTSGVTPSVANDNIVIDEPGVYLVGFDISWEGTGNGTEYHIETFLNGAEFNAISTERTFNAASVDTISSSAYGIMNLDVGDTLDVRVEASVAGADFLMSHGNFNAILIGAQGTQGKAFVVTSGYSDRNLTDALVTEVEGLTASTQDPIVLSILSDLRSTATKTAMGLSQTLKDHTIQWDGTTWYDNGTWRGPQGATGATGATGPAGEDGVANGMTAYYSRYFTGGSATAPTSPSSVTLATISAIPFRGKNVVITGYISFDNDGSDIGVSSIREDATIRSTMEGPATASGAKFAVPVFYSGTIGSFTNNITLNASKKQGGPSGLLRYRDALLEVKVLN